MWLTFSGQMLIILTRLFWPNMCSVFSIFKQMIEVMLTAVEFWSVSIVYSCLLLDETLIVGLVGY